MSCTRYFVDGERVRIENYSNASIIAVDKFSEVVGGGADDEGGDVKSEVLTLKLVDQTGQEVLFKVKKGTAMKKIFDAYKQQTGLREVRFLLDGNRVTDTDTPKMLELEDGDQIQVQLDQVGGSSGTQEDIKSEAITIKVKDQAGEIMLFKVKKGIEMKKIFDAYAQRLGVSTKQLKFTLDGDRIQESDTPKMLELDDDDQIDVFLEQVGGSGDDEDHKPSGDEAIITVLVRDSANGDEVAFKVKKGTKMSKIFDAYITRKGVQANAVRFNYEGKRIQGDMTPKMLELKEGDAIDAMIEQTGGFN